MVFDLTRGAEVFRSVEFAATTFNRLHFAGGQRFNRLSVELSDGAFIILSYRIGPGAPGSMETVEAITHFPFEAGNFGNASSGGLVQNSNFAGQLGFAPSNIGTLTNDGAFEDWPMGGFGNNNPFANSPDTAIEYRILVDIDMDGNLFAQARINDTPIRPPMPTPAMVPFSGHMRVNPGAYIRAVHAWAAAPGGPFAPGSAESAHHMYMPIWACSIISRQGWRLSTFRLATKNCSQT